MKFCRHVLDNSHTLRCQITCLIAIVIDEFRSSCYHTFA